MKQIQILALLVCVIWSASAEAFFILHIGDDLSKPEMYIPSADGLRPEPGLKPGPVSYIIDVKGSLLVPGSEIAIHRAFQHWNAVPGSTARFIPTGFKYFPLDPGWAAFDGDNAVVWVKEGWLFGQEIIAWTYLMYDSVTGAIKESDIYLNAQHYAWRVLGGSRDHPDIPAMDVENILTHEAGHMLGLAHSQVREATMNAATSPGETRRRSLHKDDMDAVRYQYPEGEDDYPGPSLWSIRKGGCTFDKSLYFSHIEIKIEAGDTTGFCLLGAGFYSADISAGLERDGNAEVPNPVSGASYVSENLVSAVLDYSGLATDAYDPCVLNPNGKTGCKFQGIFINQTGNQIPVALARAEPTEVYAGEVITLDGSSSSDPDGSPLSSFEWLVAEAPEGAHPDLFNPHSAQTGVKLEEAGVYIFYLVVNDGIVDSIADAVSVTALPKERGEDKDDYDEDLLFGCLQIEPRAKPGSSGLAAGLNLGLIFVPLLVMAVLLFIAHTRCLIRYRASLSSKEQSRWNQEGRPRRVWRKGR
jgi:hypothetical protein